MMSETDSTNMAAEVRDVRPGDRILLLEVYGVNHILDRHPIGVVADHPREMSVIGEHVPFGFVDDGQGLRPGVDPVDLFERMWFADEWTLLPEVEAVETPATDWQAAATGARAALADEVKKRVELEQELDRARRALVNFRTSVRNAVIEEAAANGWCDRTDGWLEELGLEPRDTHNAYGLPTKLGSVVFTSDGRVAILEDTDSRPWALKDQRGLTQSWLSFREVGKGGGFHVAYYAGGDEVEVNND